MSDCLILGCGYTGRRVARLLLDAGHTVWATARHPESLGLEPSPRLHVVRFDVEDAASFDALAEMPNGVRVLHSIPLLQDAQGTWHDPTPRLLAALSEKPARVVYLSTTGVYGAQTHVDETTAPAPRTPREQLRRDAELAVLQGAWSALVLRPAAIYGPGRGVHEAMRRGTFRRVGDGLNTISRIHVDDLARLATVALLGEWPGAWPVADEEPSTSVEICRFIHERTGWAMPPSARAEEVSETLRNNRHVDARATFRAFGVALRFTSYRTGIPASID